MKINISSPTLEDIIVEMRGHASDLGRQSGQMGSSGGQGELIGILYLRKG